MELKDKFKLYNSLTRNKEQFIPLDPSRVRMYVCGPTVYERPHLGNALSVVIYDVLYRVLIKLYGAEQVVYVRNITDVDDKINQAAKVRNITIYQLTQEIYNLFKEDITALNCLAPTVEPKATEHIGEMIAIIEKLIANGSAYISDGHVYFAVHSFPEYGKLAGRKLEELKQGVRIEISKLKKSADDFVLWKPSTDTTDASAIFSSPWGEGRPGWHIECSAMSSKYLGNDFDLHGGGVDLIFPHHTNEIAQSCAAHPGSHYAKIWVHNGFLTVNGEKMSKSLGNFITVRELLDKGVKNEVIRYLFLSSHYRKPMDWNEKAVSDANKSLDSFYRIYQKFHYLINAGENELPHDFFINLLDDLNTPAALACLHDYAKSVNKTTGKEQEENAIKLITCCQFLGFLINDFEYWFVRDAVTLSIQEIEQLIAERKIAKDSKNWVEADRIRHLLKEHRIVLEDIANGNTSWRYE